MTSAYTSLTKMHNNWYGVRYNTLVESVSNSIVWESEAAEAYKAKFAKLKSEIVSEFENINSQFTTLMNQAQEDIQATENANTVQ